MRKRNPAFSVRAFARRLGISPAQLSQVLSGKRPLTLKMASHVAERLGFSPRERVKFMTASSQEIAGTLSGAKPTKMLDLAEDRFQLIADWHHLAILSLTVVPGAKADPRWVARRLGIGVGDANEAMIRLRRLGILSEAPSFKQLGDAIRVAGTVPSAAIRKFHRQTLALGMDRLERVPMERREYQAMTFAIEPSKLAWFRKRLDEFLTEVCEELETPKANEVYALAVQLFPLMVDQKEVRK